MKSYVQKTDHLLKQYKVLNLNISQISYVQAISKVMDLARNKEPSYVCFANSHMTIEAKHDPNFAQMVNSANLVFADGVPIQLASKLLYGKTQERISGMDFLPDLIKNANKSKLNVFIFGSTNHIIHSAEKMLSNYFSDVSIVGSVSPPFNKNWDNERYIEIINNANPHLVFVALGCPKQEKWMAKYSKKINAVMLGIGGALPVFAGVTNNAPKWMKKNGLEWLYRLFQDPKRLWKRYLLTNSLIIWYLFIQLITKK